MSHSSLPVALLASHPPCGSLWAAPKAPLGPRFPSGQFASLALPGKRLLLPILPAGLTMSRAMELDSFLHLLERARARLFPPSKWAGLFPSAAYRRSALPQLALGRLKWRCLGCLDADCVASQHRKNGLDFFFAAGTIHTQITSLGMRRYKLNIFVTQKASMNSYPRWPF